MSRNQPPSAVIVRVLDGKQDLLHPRVRTGVEHHDELAVRRIAGSFDQHAVALVLLTRRAQLGPQVLLAERFFVFDPDRVVGIDRHDDKARIVRESRHGLQVARGALRWLAASAG